MEEPAPSPFFDPQEIADAEAFLASGRCVRPVESPADLARIRDLVIAAAAEYLHVDVDAADGFLDGIHRHVDATRLNGLRLHVIGALNRAEWVRPAYFRLARGLLHSIVGNELAMQLRLNLSIQLPGDASSLLPIHSDTWSGDSPFEVVVWLPLVDCYGTKTMFLLPPAASARLHDQFAATAGGDSEALFRLVEKDLDWLTVRYGEVLLFNQNLPHGNRVNAENATRWTLNCRFKSVFTPYADKRLGEFFEPVTLRPASRLGLDYRLPGTASD